MKFTQKEEEEINAIAEKLYSFFQSKIETFHPNKLASSVGTLEDSNGYTQKLIKDAIKLVIGEWENGI